MMKKLLVYHGTSGILFASFNVFYVKTVYIVLTFAVIPPNRFNGTIKIIQTRKIKKRVVSGMA